jgi:acyl-coenzyme A thioesterase PaaI-like protein
VTSTPDRLSIQESLYPTLTCFGCGHANPDGFHLRSYREGDLTVAEFTPRPEHDNGFGFLNGGIITTVLDCHGAAVVMWEAAQREWHAPPGAPIPFITAGFDVRFLRPTPLGPTIALVAVPAVVDERDIVVESRLEFDGKVRATMTATWRRFHPR